MCVTPSVIGLFVIIFSLLFGAYGEIEEERPDVGKTTCIINRSLNGQGFHRDLTTEVTIVSQQFQHQKEVNAEIALVESILPEMYIDLYQVAMLKEFGGPRVYSPVDIDVEKPAFQSPLHTVHLYGTPRMKGDNLYVNMTVPIHARYMKASDVTEYFTISFPSPMVLIRFIGNVWIGGMGPFTVSPVSNGTGVYWSRLACNTEGQDSVKLSIPVGQAQHFNIVVSGTLIITIGGTLYLVYVIGQSLRQQKMLNLKKER